MPQTFNAQALLEELERLAAQARPSGGGLGQGPANTFRTRAARAGRVREGVSGTPSGGTTTAKAREATTAAETSGAGAKAGATTTPDLGLPFGKITLAKAGIAEDAHGKLTIDEALSLPDPVLGSITNPGSIELTGFQKFVQGRLAAKGIPNFFGEDAAEKGREFRQKVQEAQFEQVLQEQQALRQAELFLGPDAASLPPPLREQLIAEGLIATKQVPISGEFLGAPREGVFTQDFEGRGSEFIDDEFGGHFLPRPVEQLTESGTKALQGPLGADLSNVLTQRALGEPTAPFEGVTIDDALASGDLSQFRLPIQANNDAGNILINQALRETEEGLRTREGLTKTVPALDAPLSPQALLQGSLLRRTELGTSRPQQIAGEDFARILELAGVPPEELGDLPSSTPLPLVSTAVTQAGQRVGREVTQGALTQRAKDAQAHRTKERKEREQFRNAFFDKTSQVSQKHKIQLSQIVQAQRLQFLGAQDGNKAILQRQKAQDSLEASLAMAEAKAAQTADELAVKAAMQEVQQVAAGTRGIEQSYFNSLLKVAEGSGTGSAGSTDRMFAKLVEASIKIQPELAIKYMDVLANVDPADATKAATMQAIGRVADKWVGEHKAADRIPTIMRGGDPLQGEEFNTDSQKFGALFAELKDTNSLVDKTELREAMAELKEFRVQQTRELSGKEIEFEAQAESMLATITRLEEEFDPSMVGFFGANVAKGRVIGSNFLRDTLGLDVIADLIDLSPMGRLFLGDAESFRKLISNLTGGKALSPAELELIKETQPVITNPNFRVALGVFKRNLVDVLEMGRALRSGDQAQVERARARIAERSKAFVAEHGRTDFPDTKRTQELPPFPDMKAVETEYNRLKAVGDMTDDEINEELNRRGLP